MPAAYFVLVGAAFVASVSTETTPSAAMTPTTLEDFECTDCFGTSAGPCKNRANNFCAPEWKPDLCFPGMERCIGESSTWTSTASTTASSTATTTLSTTASSTRTTSDYARCNRCVGGTRGACIMPSGLCVPQIYAGLSHGSICPAGTVYCASIHGGDTTHTTTTATTSQSTTTPTTSASTTTTDTSSLTTTTTATSSVTTTTSPTTSVTTTTSPTSSLATTTTDTTSGTTTVFDCSLNELEVIIQKAHATHSCTDASSGAVCVAVCGARHPQQTRGSGVYTCSRHGVWENPCSFECNDFVDTFDGNEYMYSLTANYINRDFSQASLICRSLGGDLASVHSKAENAFINSLDSSDVTGQYDFKPRWIGVKEWTARDEYLGEFVFIDGSPKGSFRELESLYESCTVGRDCLWAPDEPGKLSADRCVTMLAAHSFDINDETCLDKTFNGGKRYEDSDGNDCNAYGRNEGWCGAVADDYAVAGVSPNVACCACGGGDRFPHFYPTENNIGVWVAEPCGNALPFVCKRPQSSPPPSC